MSGKPLPHRAVPPSSFNPRRLHAGRVQPAFPLSRPPLPPSITHARPLALTFLPPHLPFPPPHLPFPPSPPFPSQYAEKTWKILRDAIDKINRRDASGLSFEELYRNAYNMVLHRHGKALYEGLVAVVSEHLREVVAPAIERAEGDGFLVELDQAMGPPHAQHA